MSGREVVVCRTGTANLASVFAGLRRAGGAPRMAGLAGPLRERMAAGRPTLSICVGLQLLGTTSEESPGAEGLGVIDAVFTRFPETVRVPQFG